MLKRYQLVLILIASLCADASAAVEVQSGDLGSYLNGISFGVENDGLFKVPSAGQLIEFENVVRLVLQGDYALASDAAQPLGYELVAYTDSVSAKLFYLLREINPIPSPLANGGGTYVFYPSATYNVVISAPHPRSDLNTNKEAITTFLSTDVGYLMMAGAHRRSHPDASSCQDVSDYRQSDAVHNTAHYFYVAHKAVEDFDNTVHTIELHGFSSDSLATIASQCDTGGNPAVANISDTFPDNSPEEATLMHALSTALEEGGEISACIYSTLLDTGPGDRYTRILGGTTNTAGRYTNGSTSVCDQAALTENNSHRYVHVEQSRDVRETASMRTLMAARIGEAIKDYFTEYPPTPFEINVGLNDAWYNPATSGQGFFITVFPGLGVVSLAWFTYDTELPAADTHAKLGDAGHRWLNALGPLEGNRSEMDITFATGGLFDTPTFIEEVDAGHITLTFTGCDSARIDYQIPSIGKTGSIPIRRVADDNISLCEALRKR
ncbi:MAG: hypothetical protein WBS20_18230 [Lysobacterales bacterium]